MIAGVGIDVVHIERVAVLLDSKGTRALNRLFTQGEQAYCATKAHPARHYAVRIAAKEAAFKALSGSDDARAIGWREIEVRTGDHGRPELVLHGRASRRAEELHISRFWVSLTHDHTTAAAMVVLETRE